eukprot:Gregarina_sp_Pseudo_9__1085@NODE_1706_length_1381_cov_12_041729_g1581_i0_p1_GENE_NODE_1706_length_1381_cov_12_041729_g1581_i0NODE_1706_length_1381_cov_12_041729_g1581_i0_p1_ORF_typecomplete_len377_score69_28_NODE_1706_length_1381_cov_12_041729_g1581_i01761306
MVTQSGDRPSMDQSAASHQKSEHEEKSVAQQEDVNPETASPVTSAPTKPVELCNEDVKAAETVMPKKQPLTLPLESSSLPRLQATTLSDENNADPPQAETPPTSSNAPETKVEQMPPKPIPDSTDPPQASAVLDGTKLILRLLRYQNFQVDQPLRIIFSSKPLRRIERSLNFTTYASDAPVTTVVIDTGLASHHFIPIVPALHNGVIYTRDAVAHVVIAGAGDLRRMKITSKALPYKVCNKFIASSSFVPPARRQMTDPYPKNPHTAMPLPWMPNVSAVGSQSAASGIVFLRVDDSIFRYQLGKRGCATGDGETPAEDIELQDGRLVAWSAGVEFRSSVSMWCYRRVQGVSGRGAIWLDNPRQSATPAGPPAAFAG